MLIGITGKRDSQLLAYYAVRAIGTNNIIAREGVGSVAVLQGYVYCIFILFEADEGSFPINRAAGR
jgi:hypothetical protein